MYRSLTCLTSLVLVSGLTASLFGAGLLGHWTFDEGEGGVARDSSGNNNGALLGNPAWVAGSVGSGAVNFDDSDDIIIIDDDPSLDVEDALTISLWVNTADVVTPNHMVTKQPSGTAPDNYPGNYEFRVKDNTIQFLHQTSESTDYSLYISTSLITAGQWHHAAVSIEEGGLVEFYLDGISAGSATQLGTFGILNDESLRIGGRKDNHFFNGILDDVYIYGRVLTPSQIEGLSRGIEPDFSKAEQPSVPNDAVYENTWANLAWTPGASAVSHNVYFGTNFDDVNQGAEGAFVGNILSASQVIGFPGFPAAEGLQPGTAYYWRIDEVNDADPNSPWQGDVWSFFVPPMTSYSPYPIDGSKFVVPDSILGWTGGFGAKLHSVYFGDSFEDVDNATDALPQTDATFTPGTLEMETTYYWRVDEFDGVAAHKGDVWSFTTVPIIPVADDPNLAAWWTFDEGMGTTALDWSGHGNHGTLAGPKWTVSGVFGDAALNSISGYVAIENLSYNSTDLTEVTVCAWVRTASPSDQYIISFDRNEYWRLEINGSGGGLGQVGWDVMTSSGQVDYGSVTRVDNGAWHHVCGVFDNGQMTIYIDGAPEPSVTGGTTYGSGNTRFGFIGANSEATTFDGARGGGAAVAGEIDDLRIYNKALTQEEITLVMRGDPLLAWGPNPSDGSTPDIDNATPLRWSAGDKASQHDVYFGTDGDTVKDADTSDATGIYRGAQSGTSFTPAEGVEWGGGPYYWRIDENNTDGTVTRGRVWTFAVADFILVDDFERYSDNDAANEAIWQSWIDGFGVAGNGAQVGYLLPPYAEQTIVNGGGQSMPLLYDNTAGVTNSEAALALTAPRDWTGHGLTDLSLWFRGYPVSVGSFIEAPAGTYTMTGSGADIGGAADQFHFAFKTLTGAGSIVARVNSVQNTNAWAKAGVMVRETLDAGSKHALACVTPENGVASQGRTATDAASYSTNETGITAPHWVKLERDAAGNFTASHSTNGTTWQSVADAVPANIPMTSNVHIGLAITSHDAAQMCQAAFSNVTTTGSVSGQWTGRDVGIRSNAAEPMYVALSNANGASAIVANDDPGAATIDTWTEWVIPLQAFADQGINLADVDSVAVGLGTKAGTATSGGSGTVYFDDIRLYPPEPQP